MLRNQPTIVESKLYAVQCRSLAEASYLAAIINSDAMWKAVIPLATKNWAGNSRDVQKQIWRLPIPEYDEALNLHSDLAGLGARLAEEAALIWGEIRAEREEKGKSTSVTIARRVLREWQNGSIIAKQVDSIVAQQLH